MRPRRGSALGPVRAGVCASSRDAFPRETVGHVADRAGAAFLPLTSPKRSAAALHVERDGREHSPHDRGLLQGRRARPCAQAAAARRHRAGRAPRERSDGGRHRGQRRRQTSPRSVTAPRAPGSGAPQVSADATHHRQRSGAWVLPGVGGRRTRHGAPARRRPHGAYCAPSPSRSSACCLGMQLLFALSEERAHRMPRAPALRGAAPEQRAGASRAAHGLEPAVPVAARPAFWRVCLRVPGPTSCTVTPRH